MGPISAASIISASRSTDLGEACARLEEPHAERLTAKSPAEAGTDAEVRAGHANFEMKWAGPDGVVIDISHTGWEGTH